MQFSIIKFVWKLRKWLRKCEKLVENLHFQNVSKHFKLFSNIIFKMQPNTRKYFPRSVNDHEITPNPHVDDMVECDEDDADATVRVQHVTNVTPVYEPPTLSFYVNTWENMVNPEVV